jgi:tripartite ATP-independent transporter DctP family solute receptor
MKSEIHNPQRRKVLKFSLAAAAAGAIGMPTVVQAQRAKVLRFGSPVREGVTFYKAQEVFANEIGALSGGKIKVELYPNFQLGSIKDMLTATQLGTQQIAMAVPAWFSGYAKPIDVFSLPFIVESYTRLRAALDGAFGQKVLALTEPAGFKVIGYWLMGPRQMANNLRAIHKPEDLKGMKVRTIPSPVFIETFKALGANTVGLDPAEMYLAMQQHTIDGLDNSSADLVDFKIYEVAKYISLTAHITDFFIVGMHKGTWDAFPKEEQGLLTQAMKKSMDWEWGFQPEAAKTAEAKLKVTAQFNEITAAERAAFVEATKPVYEKFEGSIGKDIIAQAIKEMGSAAT